MHESARQADLVPRENPGQEWFVGEVQPLVRKSVYFHIYKGYFKYDAAEDIIQDISLSLLQKWPSIVRLYKKNSTFRTYVTSVIFNLCRDIYRTKRYLADGFEPAERIPDRSSPEVPRSVLQDEFRKLDLYFDLTGKKKPRLVLCLKLTYKLPLSAEDLASYSEDLTEEETARIFDLNHVANVKIRDKEIFDLLNAVFNRVEGKSNTRDALRKWVDLKSDEMVQFLNGEPPTAYYNRESLQILAEKYFMEKAKKTYL